MQIGNPLTSRIRTLAYKPLYVNIWYSVDKIIENTLLNKIGESVGFSIYMLFRESILNNVKYENR
jgi:hypothetical protein